MGLVSYFLLPMAVYTVLFTPSRLDELSVLSLQENSYALFDNIPDHGLAADAEICNTHVHTARYVPRIPLPSISNRVSSSRRLFHHLILLYGNSGVPVVDRNIGSFFTSQPAGSPNTPTTHS